MAVTPTSAHRILYSAIVRLRLTTTVSVGTSVIRGDCKPVGHALQHERDDFLMFSSEPLMSVSKCGTSAYHAYQG